jgi:protein-S-isoprenylcysteine O-methyltransferase Ste14
MSSTPRPSHSSRGSGVADSPLDRIPLKLRMVFYGVFFLALVLVGLPWLVHRLDVYVPAWHVEIGLPLRVVGWVAFAAFLLTYLWCSYILSSRGKGAYVEFDPPKHFVATGPFRWTRNPIAACVVGMIFGLALAFSSTGMFLLFVIGVPLAHLQVVRMEEPLLRERFGSAYEDYMRRVPRWVPRRPADEQP